MTKSKKKSDPFLSSGDSRLRVMVLYGGRSGEHEISLKSAASVVRNLDPERFQVLAVAIDKKGNWFLNDLSRVDRSTDSLPVFSKVSLAALSALPGSAASGLNYLGSAKHTSGIDVVFPVMHGPLCEDGTIQALFELADLPYVGCGVLASAVGMDKDVAKRLAQAAGVPVVPSLTIDFEQWQIEKASVSVQIDQKLGYPVFVKPANLGSSVGVQKVKQPSRLAEAIENAFRYDTKILIERAIPAREIELSVLEDINSSRSPLVSVPGEVTSTHEFYSYDAKYIDSAGAVISIPAELTTSQVIEAQKIAREVFVALGCEGLARVDLFLDRQSGKFYFNELNTMPGFTSISMYPKLWDYSGVSFRDLLSKLIDLALKRQNRKMKLVREFDAG